MARTNILKFQLNYKGVRELLHSQEMSDVLLSYANHIASNAGEGYEAKHMQTRVIVVPGTPEAEQDNYNNNTLLKSKGGSK